MTESAHITVIYNPPIVSFAAITKEQQQTVHYNDSNPQVIAIHHPNSTINTTLKMNTTQQLATPVP